MTQSTYVLTQLTIVFIVMLPILKVDDTPEHRNRKNDIINSKKDVVQIS